MLGHLTGTCAHALVRVEGNRDMAVPWLETVMSLSNTLESDVSRSLALPLLQIGVQISPDGRDPCSYDSGVD